MADGSSCHQVAFATPEGSDVANHQCGGAVSVKFMLPEDSKFGECDLNIHEIGFDCSSGPKPPILPKPSPSSSTAPPFIRHSTTLMEVPSFTSHSIPEVTSTVWSTAEITVTKCDPTATYCPAHSTVVVTSTYSVSTTVCPSKSVETPVATHSISTVDAPSPSSSIVSPPCPNLVPKCINTWLSIPKCTSNSDAACFCPSSEFTDKVGSCIHAWGKSEQEISSALSYFAGICAPYVPKNTGIIDIVPSQTSPPPFTRPTDNVGAPATTSFRGETGTVTLAPKVPETTVTWSSSTMTCPKVGFSTFTHDTTPTVALVVPSSPATTPSPTKHNNVPSSSSKTATSCHMMSHSFTTQPAPKPTETVNYTGSGSKVIIGESWQFFLTAFFVYLALIEF